MSTVQDLCNLLKKIIKLLNEEKHALLHNEANKIIDLLELKEKLINQLSSFKGMDLLENEKVKSLIQEINSLQEVNLLLTNLALSYQEVLLDSISQTMQNNSNTYSAKGSYEATSDVKLINKKV